MKRGFYLSLFTFLILFHSTGTAQEEWSPPIIISGGVSPDFDIDRNTGHLHIVSMLDGVIYTETDSAGNILIHEEVPGTERDAIHGSSGIWTGASRGRFAMDRAG